MILRVFALSALLLVVAADSDVNNRQQKILQRRPLPGPPPDSSSRPGQGPPSNGPAFSRGPAQRPKGPPQPSFPKPNHPKVEYGFTPISAPVGHLPASQDAPKQQQQPQQQQAQPSAPAEVKKPLIISVAPPQQQQKQQQPAGSAQVAVSYQNTNFGVVEGNFKEKPSFIQQTQSHKQHPQQSQKASESQLSFGQFSFNQPVGAKINFESESKPDFDHSPFPSIESSFISAGPPKVDKFPPKPPSGPQFPPKEQHQPQSGPKFPKHPPPPPPSFSKGPPKHELPTFSAKPIKEFSNFPPPPPPPHFVEDGKRINGEQVHRIPFDSKKVVRGPPSHHPIFRGPPPPPPKKVIHQKPQQQNPSFEIQKASVVGPFTAQPMRHQRFPPPPPRPVGPPPPQEAQPSHVEEQNPLRNPEFDNFPPPDFGQGKPIHQEVPRPQAPQPSQQPQAQHLPPPQTQHFAQPPQSQHFAQPPQSQHFAQPPQSQHLPQPLPQFVQETNSQMFGGNFASFQQGQPQPQLQLQQPQFQAPSHQVPSHFNAQPQFQLQGAQPQFQFPSSFSAADLSKLTTHNPYLSSFPSGLTQQFGSLSQFQSQRINPATLGGLSAAGITSQLGLPSTYPQFNPTLAAASQLYKGILPVQQFPTTSAGSGYPFPSAGSLNPFLKQSTLPLRSSIPTSIGTHSVPSISSEGIPQFQPLPNSLNFPDQDDDEQDSAASQNLKKFIPAPKTNSTKPKKTTLKDILAEDCTGAEDFGYCASPPRYPTQQVKTILKQCKEELDGLFDESNTEEETHKVSKRDTAEAKNGEEYTWTSESCSSTAATVEPGYARDSKGHWLVVVQQASSKVYQRVDVDVCGSEGGDCGCKQYYETKSLVAWDPDHPNDCPVVRTFKFPSKCECPTK